MKKVNVYKIISVLAIAVLLFILILPQKYNVNKKQKADECIKNMNTIYKAIANYMAEREEDFTGTAQDLMRMNYLKKTRKRVGLIFNFDSGEFQMLRRA